MERQCPEDPPTPRAGAGGGVHSAHDVGHLAGADEPPAHEGAEAHDAVTVEGHPGGRAAERALTVLPAEKGGVAVVARPAQGLAEQAQDGRLVVRARGADVEQVGAGPVFRSRRRHCRPSVPPLSRGAHAGARDTPRAARMGGVGDKTAIRRLGAKLVKRAATCLDSARPPRAGVVVLAYHRIGRRSTLSVDLPTWLFAEQMARLADSGRVVDLDTALGRLKEPSPGGPDPVVVTFDDGTADFAEVALPVLQAHRLPACLYVATDFVERQRDFPAGGAPMSWAALTDTVSTGLVTIGSHTHTHALLDRLDPGLVADELDRSIGLIGDALGAPPDHFAYPKAVPGSVQADAAVRERFVSAALAGTRANPYQATDIYRLARSPVQVEDGLRWFARKAAGGMRLEDDLRRLANRWRYGGAVS